MVGLSGCLRAAPAPDSTGAPAAPTAAMFPFVIPWDDASHTAIDLSALNDGPAGSHGFIVARDGHFVESATGRRVRFLAVDFTFHADFPEHGDAAKVAARLAKYGVNLVRLHHMDNNSKGNGSIQDPAAADHRHLSPQQLDRLDYLIAQLKQHGNYVNINLHVSRQFSAADGFPPSVEQLPESYDKRVDYFDARMIELQKEYARALLTHVNPYTGHPYTDEPAVLNVEITNEDSLVGDPWQTKGAYLANLPQPFEGELQGLWNRWLLRKYHSTRRAQAAWIHGTTPPGPSVLRDPSSPQSWVLEVHPGAQATMAQDGEALKVTVAQSDGTGWHVQLNQPGLDLHDGATYTVGFRARADSPRGIGVYTGLDEADWHHVGLATTAQLTPEWKTFHYVFEAENTVPSHNRLTFAVGENTGTIWLAGITLQPGAVGAGIQAGQSLEQGTVPIPTSFTRAQQLDWLSFLADTERSYADEMRRYLTHDLHLHSLVIGSQISWGGPAGLYREQGMDFADNHAYWQHPSFPGKPWDPVNWRIGNSSMVLAMGKSDELTRLASQRVAGKPYTISEYNHPAPTDYQAEAVPLLASFAAEQDWDAIYLFDYGDYGAGAANDQVQGFFGVGSNPAKWAFFPAAAALFRMGGVQPADTAQTLTLPANPADLLSPQTERAVTDWTDAAKLSAPDARLGEQLAGSTRVPILAIPPAASGRREINWQNSDASHAWYTVDAPAAKVAVGFLDGQTVSLQGCTLEVGDTPGRFAAVTLTALDGAALAQSDRVLLTAVDRVENTGVEWNAAHDSVNNHWGHAPSLADGVPLSVTLQTAGPRTVYALASTGARSGIVPSTFANGELTFHVGPEYHTLWYELAP